MRSSTYLSYLKMAYLKMAYLKMAYLKMACLNMAYLNIAVLTVISLSVTQARAQDPASIIVDEELKTTKQDLATEYSAMTKQTSALDQLRTKVIDQSKQQAEKEAGWSENLKKYQLLLKTRYRDDKGDYAPGKELSKKDVDNINTIVGTYLHSTPLQGRTSVGKAFSALDDAIDKLKDLVKAHLNPSESNNSELEIIALETKTIRLKLERLSDLAKNLGFNPNDRQVDRPGDRVPAATK